MGWWGCAIHCVPKEEYPCEARTRTDYVCDARAPFWVGQVACGDGAYFCKRHLLMLTRQAAKLLGYTLVKKERT